MSGSVHLRLPATSANLGPAFDTAAVALHLHLNVLARAAESFSISATGRDADACGRVERNLILDTYRRILTENSRPVVPLHLNVENQIPLGMGCGSSAAARLAGIALAVEFGGLEWGHREIVDVATYLEGHPDNVTACWMGGMTVSAVGAAASNGMRPVHVARLEIPAQWRAVVIFPRDPVRTEESRKVLPSHYSRADVVENLQHCSLLVAAFAAGNDAWLQAAMSDRMHQPYRRSICNLLEEVEKLAALPGVLGVALSGAGPGILLIVQQTMDCATLSLELQHALKSCATVEVLQCGFEAQGAGASFPVMQPGDAVYS